MKRIRGFIVYRIYYGDELVYVGRTKQPLQDRLRGHFFQRPMHRTIHIEHVTRIEYTEFQTEADMNLYELYYILTLHPPLNVDDKTRDFPTVTLPDLEWRDWKAPIFDRWKEQIFKNLSEAEMRSRRYKEILEEERVVRGLYRSADISEEEKYDRLDALQEERKEIEEKLWGRKPMGGFK